MVLVFSDYSNTSRQVYREVDTAVSLGKPIIPFKCSDTMPTGSMRYYLSSLHWLDAVDEPLEQAIDVLAQRVKGLMGVGGQGEVPESSQQDMQEKAPEVASPSESAPTVSQQASAKQDGTKGDKKGLLSDKRIVSAIVVAIFVLINLVSGLVYTTVNKSKDAPAQQVESATVEEDATVQANEPEGHNLVWWHDSHD